jgi:predicted membrane protein
MAGQPERLSAAELVALKHRSQALVRAIAIALLLAALAGLLIAAAAVFANATLVAFAVLASALAIAALAVGIRAAVHHAHGDRPADVGPPRHA